MQAAFLAAITERPDDDLPRLVYADWLEENGEPDRAEFIRTQIELAKLSEFDARRPVLKAREAELALHKEAWTLPEFRGQSQVFRRGFVELVNVSAEWLVAHPDAPLTAAGPLRSLRVFTASGFLARLAELPGLARFEELDLNGARFTGADGVRNFFRAARLDKLHTLVLRNSTLWEGEELAALADTPVAPRLRSLDVSGNRIGDAGVRVLAARPEFGGLTSFTYRGDEIDYQMLVHANGAGALADSVTLTRLRTLDLGDQYIGEGGFQRLANSPNASGLERLVVDYNDLGDISDEWASDLVESRHLGSLRELVLCGNRLGPLGAEALANWPHLEQMREVDLRECRAPLGADPPPVERRRTVGDGSAPLTDAVRAILARSPWADKFLLD
jgi:uncharacterized protein (TIGR02996 family)